MTTSPARTVASVPGGTSSRPAVRRTWSRPSERTVYSPVRTTSAAMLGGACSVPNRSSSPGMRLHTQASKIAGSVGTAPAGNWTVFTASVVISPPGETGVASWAPVLPSVRGLTLRRSPTISAGIMNRRMPNLPVCLTATGVAGAGGHHRPSIWEVRAGRNAGECGLPGVHHQIPVPRERWRWTLIVWAGTSFRKRPTVLTAATDSGGQRLERSHLPTAERLLSHRVPVHELWHSSWEPTGDVVLRTEEGKGGHGGVAERTAGV